MLRRAPLLGRMLDANDETGGISNVGGAAVAGYRPEASNPSEANAMKTALWEVGLQAMECTLYVCIYIYIIYVYINTEYIIFIIYNLNILSLYIS